MALELCFSGPGFMVNLCFAGLCKRIREANEIKANGCSLGYLNKRKLIAILLLLEAIGCCDFAFPSVLPVIFERIPSTFCFSFLLELRGTVILFAKREARRDHKGKSSIC